LQEELTPFTIALIGANLKIIKILFAMDAPIKYALNNIDIK